LRYIALGWGCRVIALLAEGDLVGRDIWRQVLAAVQELQRVKPREGERAN
jgi:hypothetical protein